MCRRIPLVPVLAVTILVARPAAAGFTERVSVGLGGMQSNGTGVALGVSSDGQLVSFHGLGATNLHGGPAGRSSTIGVPYDDVRALLSMGQCGDARNACTVTSMGDRIDCR